MLATSDTWWTSISIHSMPVSGWFWIDINTWNPCTTSIIAMQLYLVAFLYVSGTCTRKPETMAPVFELTFRMLIIATTMIASVQSAFPFEEDLDRLTGMSFPKSWMVFMERRLIVWMKCNGVAGITSLMGFLHCAACRVGCKNRYNLPEMHSLEVTEPNTLRYLWRPHGTDYHRLSLMVHHQYSLNMTVTHFRLVHPDDVCNTNSYRVMIVAADITREYCVTRFPWTLLSRQPSVSLTIMSPCRVSKCITIE